MSTVLLAVLLLFWVGLELLRARRVLGEVRDLIGKKDQADLSPLLSELKAIAGSVREGNRLANKAIAIQVEESARIQPIAAPASAPRVDIMEALKRSLAAKRAAPQLAPPAEGRPQKPQFSEPGFENETLREFELREDAYMEALIEFKAREMLSTAFGISF